VPGDARGRHGLRFDGVADRVTDRVTGRKLDVVPAGRRERRVGLEVRARSGRPHEGAALLRAFLQRQDALDGPEAGMDARVLVHVQRQGARPFAARELEAHPVEAGPEVGPAPDQHVVQPDAQGLAQVGQGGVVVDLEEAARDERHARGVRWRGGQRRRVGRVEAGRERGQGVPGGPHGRREQGRWRDRPAHDEAAAPPALREAALVLERIERDRVAVGVQGVASGGFRGQSGTGVARRDLGLGAPRAHRADGGQDGRIGGVGLRLQEEVRRPAVEEGNPGNAVVAIRHGVGTRLPTFLARGTGFVNRAGPRARKSWLFGFPCRFVPLTECK
jgi:hypothetical protein